MIQGRRLESPRAFTRTHTRSETMTERRFETDCAADEYIFDQVDNGVGEDQLEGPTWAPRSDSDEMPWTVDDFADRSELCDVMNGDAS